MRNIYILCFTFFAMSAVSSQELFIIVYKGSVHFAIPGRSAKLDYGSRYAIPKESAIEYGVASKFIVFTRTKFFEERNANANKMDYATMIKNLKSNMIGSFSKFMNDYHRLTELGEESKGSIIAGTRGLNDKKGVALEDDERNYAPADLAQIGTSTVQLKWNLREKVPGAKMMVIYTESNDTIYNKPAAQSGTADIPLVKAGNYDWFLYSGMEKKKRINRSFTKLDPAEAKAAADALNIFKKEIAPLSPEMQELLIEEYLSNSNAEE
ncbi:MAG TPA: hypothetical protein VK528_12510 [Flavobacterium sp.]|nr:hypothetical protein [Flavobacterium sp.]